MGNTASSQSTSNYDIRQSIKNNYVNSITNEFVNVMINSTTSKCNSTVTATQKNTLTIESTETGDITLENKAFMTAECAIRNTTQSDVQNGIVQALMNSFNSSADAKLKEALQQKASTDFGDIGAKVETRDQTSVNINTSIENTMLNYVTTKVNNEMQNIQVQTCDSSAFASQENVVSIRNSKIGNIVVTNGVQAAFKCMLGGDIVNKIVNSIDTDIKTVGTTTTSTATDKALTQDAKQTGAITSLGNAVSNVLTGASSFVSALTGPAKLLILGLILILPMLLFIFMKFGGAKVMEKGVDKIGKR
jgi:hypothetical protein